MKNCMYCGFEFDPFIPTTCSAMQNRCRNVSESPEFKPKQKMLTLGQAIDKLASGEAKRVTCYSHDSDNYVSIDKHTGELRLRSVNGYFYPLILGHKETHAKWRVIE